MKKVFLNTFSFLMAILVLFSTMSFTVEKHFCGKSLVGHAVFSSVKKCKSETHSCGVDSMMGHMKMDKEACCSDETDRIEGQDELNFASTSFDFIPQTFIIPLSFIIVDLLPELSPEVINYPPYQPPQLVYDIQVLCQVFTI
ncbi:HYC_CC_PP family protein [Salinimicrobium oceani]|jgi:hypothetical protein|nr:hypothetical protein [Salinimicrobium oceani]